jgi:hypothetical protein
MKKHKEVFLIGTVAGIVIASESRPDLKDILKAAAVTKGSYAEELIERIYAFFIETAIDLKGEYQKYYELEYKNILNFLYHKYAMDEEDLPRLSALSKSCDCLLLIKERRWGRDYQIDSLFEYSEQGRDLIMQTLNATLIG